MAGSKIYVSGEDIEKAKEIDKKYLEKNNRFAKRANIGMAAGIVLWFCSAFSCVAAWAFNPYRDEEPVPRYTSSVKAVRAMKDKKSEEGISDKEKADLDSIIKKSEESIGELEEDPQVRAFLNYAHNTLACLVYIPGLINLSNLVALTYLKYRKAKKLIEEKNIEIRNMHLNKAQYVNLN